MEAAHELQLKYYMYVFEKNGIEGISGVLEYPVLRKKDSVILSDIDREMIREIEFDIQRVVESMTCPPIEKKRICKNCSYFDFCFSGEEEI